MKFVELCQNIFFGYGTEPGCLDSVANGVSDRAGEQKYQEIMVSQNYKLSNMRPCSRHSLDRLFDGLGDV